MNRCTRCNDTTHLEWPTGGTRCDGCDRLPSWCRCQPSKAEQPPRWLQRAQEKPYGLARDLTGTAA